MSWQPESVTCPQSSLETSYLYITPIPRSIAQDEGVECILGVDEAGRGPVLGPMVYGVAYCSTSYAESIPKHGFMDSKVLDHDTRVDLLHRMSDPQHELHAEVGWTVRVMSARDIAADMLRPTAPYNLNAQAHDTTIQLIRDVYAQGINVRKIFVDTVGIAETYQAKLQRTFPMAEVTVSKKADSIYPIVSVASICAKVTRDKALEVAAEKYASTATSIDTEQEDDKENRAVIDAIVQQTSMVIKTKKRKNEFDSDISDDEQEGLKREESAMTALSTGSWGSGYPSDPRTKIWLHDNVNAIFGWQGPVRYSWATVKDILEATGRSVGRKDAVKVEWFDDLETEDGQQMLNFAAGNKSKKEGFTISNCFGRNIGHDGFKV